MSDATAAVRTAAARGAPSRRLVVRAVTAGAVAQLAGVALIGGAAGLLTWSSSRPGLAAVAGLLLAVELVAFARAPLRHGERMAAHDLGLGGLAGWRSWLLDSVAAWAPSRLAAARAGDLLARCLEDTDRLQDLWVRSVVPGAATACALVVAAVGLAIVEPIAGAALALATLLVGAATWSRARRIATLGTAEAALRGSAAARAVELTRGAEALRLLGAAEAHLEGTAALVERADDLAMRRERTGARLGLLSTAAAGFALVAAVAGAHLPTHDPGLAAGVALATLACGELLGALPLALDPLGSVAGAATRLDALATPVRHPGALATPGPLALDDVDVAPAEIGPVLLAHVALEVRPDETVCVTGPTGSGKSSLLAVAAGLEPPRRGTVRLDGTDVTTVDEPSLRACVGWLPAHPALLEGRVRDVLDLGRGIDDETLATVVERVGLGVVLDGRGGLDAVVGTHGEGLSVGEERLLAVARLLALAPATVVLDEPTAGLDEKTATRLLDAVDECATSVLVATHDAAVLARSTSHVRVVEGRVEPVEGAR